MNLKIVLGGAVAAATAVVLTSVAIAQNTQSDYQNPGQSVHDLNRNATSTYNNATGQNQTPSTAPPAAQPDQSMNNGANTGGYGSTYRGYTNAPSDTAQDQSAAPSGGMAGERG